MIARRCTLLFLAAIMAEMALFQAIPARAAVGNLTSALLRPSDAPAGFGQSHYKVYTAFSNNMLLAIGSKGGKRSTATCSVDKRYSAYGWKQGIIQAFDQTRVSALFEMCGYLFKSNAGAHLAFESAVKNAGTTQGGVRFSPLRLGTIGDESIAVGAFEKKIKSSVLLIAVRHANALLGIFYLGQGKYSAESMRRSAQQMNARLP